MQKASVTNQEHIDIFELVFTLRR